MNEIIKKYPTIGACGIDCGLCPRYYTDGPSRCPGCGGPKFSTKHPSCPILTCCVKKKCFETCSECLELLCSRLKDWDKADSFVTHKVSISNLKKIKEIGLKRFLKQQEKRIELLNIFLKEFDEGRSKSFYCISCTLLPINFLEEALKRSYKKIADEGIRRSDLKSRSKVLREQLNIHADKGEIDLKLRR